MVLVMIIEMNVNSINLKMEQDSGSMVMLRILYFIVSLIMHLRNSLIRMIYVKHVE